MKFSELGENQPFYLPETAEVVIYRKVDETHYTNNEGSGGEVWTIDPDKEVVAIKWRNRAGEIATEEGQVDYPATIKFCDLRPGDRFRKDPHPTVVFLRLMDPYYVSLSDPECKPLRIPRPDLEVRPVRRTYKYTTRRTLDPLPPDQMAVFHNHLGEELVAAYFDERSERPYVYYFRSVHLD